jgi:hypothetical protein
MTTSLWASWAFLVCNQWERERQEKRERMYRKWAAKSPAGETLPPQQQSLRTEREKRLPAQDDAIEELDPQQLPRLAKPPGT